MRSRSRLGLGIAAIASVASSTVGSWWLSMGFGLRLRSSYQNQSPKLWKSCEKPMLGLREALVISWMCWERKGFRRQCAMSFSSARSLHGEQQRLNLADVLIQKLSPCSSQCLAHVPGKWQPSGIFKVFFQSATFKCVFLVGGTMGNPQIKIGHSYWRNQWFWMAGV